MKRILIPLGLMTIAAEVSEAKDWTLSQSGIAGIYYGIMETKEDNNLDNMANRLVFRADGKISGYYPFSQQTKIGVNADYTIVMRQHDKDYEQGDWRFYPYAHVFDEKKGQLTVGYTYNAARIMHVGAQDITWVGIQDSNISYFLSSANWSNGQKKTKFATPKSTTILDDGRAFKLSYFTPEMGNTILGFSYTPDNASRRGMTSRYTNYETTQDGYTASMQNHWNLPYGELYTSTGYGLYNRTDNVWSGGMRWIYKGLKISGGYKKSWIDGHKNPISTTAQNEHLPAYFDNYREGQAWDFSIGYDFGKFESNLAYLHTEAENTRHRDDIWVQSNKYQLNKYVELYWVNAYRNSKGYARASNNNNKGYAIITGIALKY